MFLDILTQVHLYAKPVFMHNLFTMKCKKGEISTPMFWNTHSCTNGQHIDPFEMNMSICHIMAMLNSHQTFKNNSATVNTFGVIFWVGRGYPSSHTVQMKAINGNRVATDGEYCGVTPVHQK